jgi:hypothetical protein
MLNVSRIASTEVTGFTVPRHRNCKLSTSEKLRSRFTTSPILLLTTEACKPTEAMKIR